MIKPDNGEMPPPIFVELVAHDPDWAMQALREAERLHDILGPPLNAVHHIGSTAVPGLCAKPIIDLLAVVADLPSLDARRTDMEREGYAWWGEYGLAGRRYCTRDDASTGRRQIQLHAFARTSAEAITHHIAFRDYLRANPLLARDYEREKRRCAALHRHNSHAYTDCKSAWVARTEAEAMKTLSRSKRADQP